MRTPAHWADNLWSVGWALYHLNEGLLWEVFYFFPQNQSSDPQPCWTCRYLDATDRPVCSCRQALDRNGKHEEGRFLVFGTGLARSSQTVSAVNGGVVKWGVGRKAGSRSLLLSVTPESLSHVSSGTAGSTFLRSDDASCLADPAGPTRSHPSQMLGMQAYIKLPGNIESDTYPGARAASNHGTDERPPNHFKRAFRPSNTRFGTRRL